MSTQSVAGDDNSDNLLDVFAKTQLALINRDTLVDSTFLTLATCAFFYGAEKQLRKQGQTSPQLSRAKLVGLLVRTCRLSERNTLGIIKSIKRLADQYYLIEHIVQQGHDSADSWLNCETVNKPILAELVQKYRNLSMFDLGIEGVNPKHEALQQQFYSTVDQSVGKMRRRFLIFIAYLSGISLAMAAVYRYFA